jgi:hypothetical protein
MAAVAPPFRAACRAKARRYFFAATNSHDEESMTRTSVRGVFLAVVLGLPVLAAAQQSLGDLARALREQRDKAAKKPTKVYTNDDLPALPPGQRQPPAAGFSSAPPAPQPFPEVRGPAQPAGGAGGGKPESLGDKKRTKDYWQGKFKPLRGELAKAEEDQQLVEDELNLLQIQAARELNATAKQELEEKIKDKQATADAKRAVTAPVRKKLQDLEKEFKDSGAPDDWSKTD